LFLALFFYLVPLPALAFAGLITGLVCLAVGVALTAIGSRLLR
jgi:hypothetical protein